MEAASTPLPSRETAPPSAPTNIPGPTPKDERMCVDFLGPFGTSTEQAVRQVTPTGAGLVPMTFTPHALATLHHGEVDCTVTPIGNSIEGGVNATLDSLTHGDPLMIVTEAVVPVVFQLVARLGTRPEDVHRIGAHSHAWAQCHNWVGQAFPGTIHVSTTLTVAGAQLLMSGGANFDAALYFAVSVNTYEVEPLFRDVTGNPDVATCFVLVAPPGDLSAPTGTDEATIQAALSVNKSDALLALLEQFAACGVDLSRIESRPSGDALGDYTFSINIVGHVVEEWVQAALVGLHQCSPEVRFMGSYPRVDGRYSVAPPETRDEDFQEGRV